MKKKLMKSITLVPLIRIDVKHIAEIVVEEMDFQNVKFTGGVNGGRGWKGDVKTMLLSVRKLSNSAGSQLAIVRRLLDRVAVNFFNPWGRAIKDMVTSFRWSSR